MGLALIVGSGFVHPTPSTGPVPRARRPAASVSCTASPLRGRHGRRRGLAWLATAACACPERLYPGALLNAVATAFLDEAAFRGALLGFLLAGHRTRARDPHPGADLRAGDAARRARPGPLILLSWRSHRARRRLADGLTGGIGAAFLGHAVTRFAVFLTTGHAGQSRPRGREMEEIERRRRPPEGWRSSGRGSRRPATGSARADRQARPPPRAPTDRGAARRRSRSTSTSRSASRSARTATSWSTPGAAARGPANRIGGFVAALLTRDRASGRCARRAFGRLAPVRPPLDTLYLGGGTPSLLPPDDLGGVLEHVRERFGIAPGRGDPRGQPGPGRTGRPGGARRGPASTALVRGPEPRPRASSAARPAPPARRRGGCVAGPERPGSARSTSTSCTTCPADARDLDRHARGRPGARARPPVALRADPRRPRRRRPDRPDGDHLPTTARRAPLARPGARGAGRGPRGRPVPPRRRTASPRRLARLRDQQLGPARPREPPQPGLLGAPAVRGRRARGPCLRRPRPAAGTPPASMATWRRSRRPTVARAALPPGGPRRSTRRRRRPRRSILGLRTDRGLPRRGHEPPLRARFGWALAAELLEVDRADRWS